MLSKAMLNGKGCVSVECCCRKGREFTQKFSRIILSLAGSVRGRLLLFLALLCKYNSRCVTALPPVRPQHGTPAELQQMISK